MSVICAPFGLFFTFTLVMCTSFGCSLLLLDARDCCFPLQCGGLLKSESQFFTSSEVLSFCFGRTKFESRDKQQQARMTSLETEKTSLCDELKSTVNELTQVGTLLTVCIYAQFFLERGWAMS